MALTPEDVVNKRFQPTKFREGYDQDEVDDFLDEIVVELRRLNQETTSCARSSPRPPQAGRRRPASPRRLPPRRRSKSR
jgi:DivIVA domain-containing protein